MSADVIQFKQNPNVNTVKSLIDLADVNNVIEADDLVWTCGCGHPLFFVTKESGIVCQACGRIQTWNNDKP